MIVSLAKYAYASRTYLLSPTSRHITVSREQQPSLTATLCNDLRIAYILSFVEMLIVNNKTEPRVPQFSG
jgi:hypothetical protein